MAFCNNCGAKLDENAVFCGNCGTHIAPQPQTPPANNPYPAQHQKSTSDTVITVLAIVLAVIAIFAAAFIIGRTFIPKDEPATADATNAPVTNYVNHGDGQVRHREPFIPYRNDYIFPSDRVYLTESDLDTMSKDKIAYVRNEIYARHGYIFHQEPFKSYFESQDWYYPDRYFDESDFSAVEMHNKTLIVEYETRMGWR